jgi:hypothetical protein
MLSRPHSQLLVNSVLEFLNTVTDVLFFYVESNDECSFFSTQMLAVVEAYRATQLDRYRSAEFLNATGNSEEQQTRDMIILIEVLCHSISKTYMPQFEGSGSVENSAKIALIGKQQMNRCHTQRLISIPNSRP